ncbi:MAG: glycoside hydrolase family 36 protein [Candidatus Latescibacterota bacterium]
MRWDATLNNGRLDVSYDGLLVLEGVGLCAREAEGETHLALRPYGKPYTVPAPAGDQVITHFSFIHQGEIAQGNLLEVSCGPTRVCIRLYPIGGWWEYALYGNVHWGEEPYLCRIEPGASPQVFQSGLGAVESRLCDSLFDKWTDRLLRFGANGQRQITRDRKSGACRVETQVTATFGAIPDVLSAEVIADFITEGRGMPHYIPYDRTHHPLPHSGWESWYCCGNTASEEDLVTTTDWLKEHLKPFGCDVVQLDEGYEGESWLEWRKDFFPRGPKWIADYIRSAGFTPGIWVMPQSLGKVDSRYLQTKPDWVLRHANGDVFHGFLDYPYVDPTHPEVKGEWFGKVFRTMSREWGFGFFKIDGEGEMHQWYALCRDQLHDPSVTPDEAYRDWLRIIRDAMGPERTLLICSTQWRAMGYGDCCRTGPDVGGSWEGAEAALRATFSNYWMHTIAWYNDPDVLIVGQSLTMDQAQAWSSLLGLSGQILLNSDRVHELPEERVELLRRVFPAQDIRPMELFSRLPHGPYPQIWDLKVAKDWDSWDVVGLFRWYEKNDAEVRITPEVLGLPPGRYVLYDVWEKTYLGELGDGKTFQLKPESCRVLCVRALGKVPLLLGTSRHLTQGYPDLESLTYEDAVLSGKSMLVAGDPYEIRVLTEHEGQRCRCVGVRAPGTEIETSQEGPVLVVTLKSETSGQVTWEVRFEAS